MFFTKWIACKYIAQRGSLRFQPSQIKVAGHRIPRWFLQVDTQLEIEDYEKLISIYRENYVSNMVLWELAWYPPDMGVR